MEFKPGDVVWLKSGGMPMTVERTGRFAGERKVVTVWFDGPESRKGIFMPDVLQHEAPEGMPV